MSNVIPFPKSHQNKHQENITPENIKENVDELKLIHINETVSAIIPNLLQQIAIAGFEVRDINQEGLLKDGAFLIAAVTSLLYRYYDMFHPLQKISDTIFIVDPNEHSLKMIKDFSINLDVDSDE